MRAADLRLFLEESPREMGEIYKANWETGGVLSVYTTFGYEFVFRDTEVEKIQRAIDGRTSKQIDKLANFIMTEVIGEPSRSEGAVDCAIRVIRELMERVREGEA